jgi:Tat protein translocase TatB subunit
MSFSSIVLIMAVALILFGPEDLPVIARTLGKFVGQIRRFAAEMSREFHDAIESPAKVIDEVLKEVPEKEKPSSDTVPPEKDTDSQEEKPDEPEEFLTYEDSTRDSAGVAPGSTEMNPLADLPPDIVVYPADKQEGE